MMDVRFIKLICYTAICTLIASCIPNSNDNRAEIISYNMTDLKLDAYKAPNIGDCFVSKMQLVDGRLLLLGNGKEVYSFDPLSGNFANRFFSTSDALERQGYEDSLLTINLEIVVDTVSTFQMNKSSCESGDTANSLPVFLVNRTDTLALVFTEGVGIKLRQEALDEDGNWKPIEYRLLEIFDDIGSSVVLLYPNHFLLAGVRKYQGNFLTKLRVKFEIGGKIIYSKPFIGTINKAQFQIPMEYRNYSTDSSFSPVIL